VYRIRREGNGWRAHLQGAIKGAVYSLYATTLGHMSERLAELPQGEGC
jgi:hypothetical protein